VTRINGARIYYACAAARRWLRTRTLSHALRLHYACAESRNRNRRRLTSLVWCPVGSWRCMGNIGRGATGVQMVMEQQNGRHAASDTAPRAMSVPAGAIRPWTQPAWPARQGPMESPTSLSESLGESHGPDQRIVQSHSSQQENHILACEKQPHLVKASAITVLVTAWEKLLPTPSVPKQMTLRDMCLSNFIKFN
jgi:hypothetical protein